MSRSKERGGWENRGGGSQRKQHQQEGGREDGRDKGLTILQSVGSSPGRPRWERFITNFQGEKGSLATTCPVKLKMDGRREGGRENTDEGGEEREGREG